MRSFSSIVSLGLAALASANVAAARPRTTSTTSHHTTTTSTAKATTSTHARVPFPTMYYVSGMTLDIGEQFLFPTENGERLIQQFTGGDVFLYTGEVVGHVVPGSGSTVGLVNSAGVVTLNSFGSTQFIDPANETAYAYFSVTGMQYNASTYFHMDITTNSTKYNELNTMFIVANASMIGNTLHVDMFTPGPTIPQDAFSP